MWIRTCFSNTKSVQQSNGRHDYVLWTSMVKEVTIGEIADMAAGE